jgi:hypothetical protein
VNCTVTRSDCQSTTSSARRSPRTGARGLQLAPSRMHPRERRSALRDGVGGVHERLASLERSDLELHLRVVAVHTCDGSCRSLCRSRAAHSARHHAGLEPREPKDVPSLDVRTRRTAEGDLRPFPPRAHDQFAHSSRGPSSVRSNFGRALAHFEGVNGPRGTPHLLERCDSHAQFVWHGPCCGSGWRGRSECARCCPRRTRLLDS